jgi:Ribonucleotide reductase, all-alpha domain/ATP cone domain
MPRTNQNILYVTKRDGRREIFDANKVLRRLEGLISYNNHTLYHVNASSLCAKIVRGMYDGVTTTEIDTLAAESAASLCTQHFEYATLAARIAITQNHKITPSTFSKAMKSIYHSYQENNNHLETTAPLRSKNRNYLHQQLIDLIERNGDIIDSRIQHDRDLDMTYFGYKTLERAYLLRGRNGNISDMIVERPQYLLMRVALGIHCTGFNETQQSSWADEKERLDAAFETYDFMSRGVFLHASVSIFLRILWYPIA